MSEKTISKKMGKWATAYIVMLFMVVGSAMLFKDKIRGIIDGRLGEVCNMDICVPVEFLRDRDREVASEDKKCLEACLISAKGEVSCRCVDSNEQ